MDLAKVRRNFCYWFMTKAMCTWLLRPPGFESRLEQFFLARFSPFSQFGMFFETKRLFPIWKGSVFCFQNFFWNSNPPWGFLNLLKIWTKISNWNKKKFCNIFEIELFFRRSKFFCCFDPISRYFLYHVNVFWRKSPNLKPTIKIAVLWEKPKFQ